MLAASARSGVLVACGAALVGCNLRHELVSPEHTGSIIDEDAASGPTGANGIRIGALGSLRLQTGGGSGETFWQLGGLLADEWKSSSGSVATNEIDRRSVSTSNASLTAAYNSIQQARGHFRDAIVAMETYRPYDPAWRGELYLGLGFLELQMAETLCNGIPIGSTVDGVPRYGPPLTTEAVFNLAIAHFDSALALTTGTDTASARVRPAILVARARALVNLAKLPEAAALVAAVATSYQYVFTFSTASGLNGNWTVNSSLTQYTLSDSTDATGQVRNALPFVSARDPRVPSANPNRRGVDGVTPLFTQSIWTNTGQIPLLSGVDARLIEAEAKLKANDIPGMTTTLNTLRTTSQTLGTFRPATQTALQQPSSQAAATTAFFREKAFWTFGRGQRLGDLRRLVRQYGISASTVFPTGTFFKGGAYGDDVNFPVPDAERANPLFTGCTDRNA
jgi:hypothetical protein